MIVDQILTVAARKHRFKTIHRERGSTNITLTGHYLAKDGKTTLCGHSTHTPKDRISNWTPPDTYPSKLTDYDCSRCRKLAGEFKK